MAETTGTLEISEIEVDLARPEDAEGIANVQQVTWLATYPNDEQGITREDIAAKVAQWGTPESIGRVRESIEQPPEGTLRLVARNNGKVVGHCYAIKRADARKLQVLYVLPEYQGHGIGYRLAARAITWLSDDQDIALEVVKYNAGAIEFYKRLGFEIAGDAFNPVANLPSGANMPEYRMVKRASRR